MTFWLEKFKSYFIEVFYLFIIAIIYLFISVNYGKYLTETPSDLIRLIKMISSSENNHNFWVVTDTSVKTIKKILNTNQVISSDSVVNLNRPENIENAFNILKRKFNLPIYFVINSDDSDFKNKFTEKNINFPFKKIYGYGNGADNYTLYMFNSKD